MADAKEKFAVPSCLELEVMSSQAETGGSTGKALLTPGAWGQEKRVV